MGYPRKLKPPPIDTTPISKQLANIRKMKGFTQYTLADSIGVSRKQISDYERGLALPNSDMIVRLAAALKVSADSLLGLKHIETATTVSNVRFSRRIKEVEQLPESKKRIIVKILDEFLNQA